MSYDANWFCDKREQTFFYPDAMLFGGIVGVFEKQEVHVCSRSRSGLRYSTVNPLLLSSKAKTLTDMEGLSFSKRYLFCLNGKIQPLDV